MKRVGAIALVMSCAIMASACGRYASNAAAVRASATVAPAYATPPGRQSPAIAYDPDLHELIMFGGATMDSQLNDTWAWDGKGWFQLHPATIPAGGGSLAYDSATHQFLLFTGGGSSPSGQTGPAIWAWKNSDWVQVRAFPVRNCQKNGGSGMTCTPPMNLYPEGLSGPTFDDALGKIMGFSGRDTWTWDGRNWSDIASIDYTVATCFCFAYDSARRELMTVAISGGKFSPALGHTLVLDGSAWRDLGAPTPAQTGMVIYDSVSQTVLMLSAPITYGGVTQPTPEMWSWNGTAWRQINIAVPPAVLSGATAAYDPGTKQVVFFGGADNFGNLLTDTWVWDGRSWQKKA